MNIAADLVTSLGHTLQARGRLDAARVVYACATVLDPSSSSAWFNRGLNAKLQRRWRDSLNLNKRASKLDPNDPPVWWNLGIAATAIGDWATAREAWSRYGIDVPKGEGPLEMNLGQVPIRVSPALTPEVVWCRRVDPARAVVLSVPTPESGRGCGDLLLHDGVPRGTRQHLGRDVPVFDELQVLLPGSLHTYVVKIESPAPDDIAELEQDADAEGLKAEDWSTIRWLCQQCSEGSPHRHEDASVNEWHPQRTIAIAAGSDAAAKALLSKWAQAAPARTAGGLECVLRRPQ